MGRPWTIAVMSGVVATFALPSSQAQAQSCAAFPSSSGQASIGATVALPDGGTALGLEGSWNRPGPLGLFASATAQRADGDEAGDRNTFGGGVSWALDDALAFLPDRITVCPVAGVTFIDLDGSTRLYLPLGLGIASPFPLRPDGPSLIPHLMPRFVPTRTSMAGITVRDYHFGIGFGLLATLAPFYAGMAFDHLLVDRAPLEWALRGGMTFTWR